MTEIAKSVNVGPSLATTIPSHNHMIGPDLEAGEDIGAFDACYIASDGFVRRAIADQASAAAAQNDVQTLNVNGSPTGGTFVLQFPQVLPGGGGANNTPALAYNASNAAVQTALQALPGVGAGNALVTGTYPQYIVTFAGALAGNEQDLIVVDPSLLQPLASPGITAVTITVLHTTIGRPTGAGNTYSLQSRVRGFAPIRVRNGQPITLYDACIAGYSDQLLVPGADLFLSGTVPGGLTDVSPIPNARPVAFSMDNTRIYCLAVL